MQIKAVTDRFSEPSTYAGLSTLCLVLATMFPVAAPILIKVAAGFGSMAVAMREKK